jgi:3-oxoacyl-[acyl-carrier-protein] synthase-3
MRFDPPLSIAGTGVWLPDTCEIVTDAIREGRLERRHADANGYVTLTASEIPPPEMAVRAAAQALDSARVSRDDIGMLVHAWTYYQGQDYWEPVHYILNELSLYSATPVGVSLGCNGGFAAFEVAAARMAADDRVRAVVITTGERFCLPRFDRWRANLDVGYGDSGTAMVVRTGPAGGPFEVRSPFEVLSTANTSDPRFEGMYRGSEPWNRVPFERAESVDVSTQIRKFMATGQGPRFGTIAATAVRGTVAAALDLAGISPDDPRIRIIAPPRFGMELITRSYADALAGFTKAEVMPLGRFTGHLGAGDLAANLAEIHASGTLEPGQVALFLSATAGFTWSCMVVRAT